MDGPSVGEQRFIPPIRADALSGQGIEEYDYIARIRLPDASAPAAP